MQAAAAAVGIVAPFGPAAVVVTDHFPSAVELATEPAAAVVVAAGAAAVVERAPDFGAESAGQVFQSSAVASA